MHVGRYEPGTELSYEVTGVFPARTAMVRLRIVKFVGGGFAGQVYKVEILGVDPVAEAIQGLHVGGLYAMKILIPPSNGSRVFRDAIYRVGFQAPFGLQCNPFAARAGALWQKFIRRAAAVRFGDERSVVDILGTFVDSTLGSCGEISEWVDGRVWRYEVNDHLDVRKRWKHTAPIDPQAGSPEYCAKRKFMADFVTLLHEMGAPEFARQYEWWTCKSQPNALKRLDTNDEPLTGLTAVDFRAGLALLPFLPMSPGDVPLIFKGLSRGRLVQFDRGSLKKLNAFVASHDADFHDMAPALEELTRAEKHYRDGQIDVTHNHARLLYSPKLWGEIRRANVTGWAVRNITDEKTAASLHKHSLLSWVFWLLGGLPALGVAAAIGFLVVAGATGCWNLATILPMIGGIFVVPPLAILLRKVWGRADRRKHYASILTSGRYFLRALYALRMEKLTAWLRAGRVSDATALRLSDSLPRYCAHLPLSVLPIFLHRLLTDRQYARELAHTIFIRPVKLYFNAEMREQWLRDMVTEGRKHHMLTDEDAETILSRIKEPFIQKYLKSLAVHVCTLPVTQIVSVGMAIWYKIASNLTWGQAWDEMLLILAAFQVTPISPGSMVRGLYVLYLVIRERNFKDYNIAVFMGFFKYIGYLSFPIQMAYRYPTLARFMAAHWATGAVRIVPVFGERGALLEHGVFDAFYNKPLTIRRRLHEKDKARETLSPRIWHVPAIIIGLPAIFTAVDWTWIQHYGHVAPLKQIWWLAILAPMLAGAAATIFAGKAGGKRRMLMAFLVGIISAVAVTAIHGGLMVHAARLRDTTIVISWWKVFAGGLLWRVLAFTCSVILGALLAEVCSPYPGMKTPRE
ncbi:MAG: hypothetical protein JXA11_16230 [Phycisphaerae bacterium]|nr:hypothetical protein [Phycisphaerae bacterium]